MQILIVVVILTVVLAFIGAAEAIRQMDIKKDSLKEQNEIYEELCKCAKKDL